MSKTVHFSLYFQVPLYLENLINSMFSGIYVVFQQTLSNNPKIKISKHSPDFYLKNMG